MAKYNEVAKRLREALHESKMTAQELSNRSGVGKSSISHYMNGFHCPSNINAGKMAKVLNVYAAWLMGLSDDKYGHKATIPAHAAIRIPVLGTVSAGIPIEAVEEVLGWEEIPSDMAKRGEYFALKIKGDSMAPRILHGDTVIVRQQPDVESGDIAIVRINGDEATCKRVLKQEDSITLVPFNPSYAPRTYNKKEIAELPIVIIGKVVELRGKF